MLRGLLAEYDIRSDIFTFKLSTSLIYLHCVVIQRPSPTQRHASELQPGARYLLSHSFFE
jgi:hypothetical protein